LSGEIGYNYGNPKVRWAAGILGAAAAVSVWVWPAYAFVLQQLLYSTLVVGLILFAVWPERGKPKYWRAWLAVIAIHIIVVVAIRGLFPFHYIWLVAAIAVAECSVLALILFRISGE
jgi:hypothetical protein